MKYGVIYADPPWKFSTYSNAGKGRSAEAWYDCMDIKDIQNLPVINMAADDCVLLLWVTDPFLKTGLDVIDSWGFIYKTVGFYWTKPPETWFGTGYWTRANPEQCLLATIGSPKRKNANVPKWINSPRREHSRKPDEAYDRIENLCYGPYLELFARNRHLNWDAIGNEAELGMLTERRWKSNKHPNSKKILDLDFGDQI